MLARRGQKAAALHDLADLVRFRYGIDLPAPAEARALLESTRAIWNDRGLLLDPDSEAVDFNTEQAIRTDLLDLTIASVELSIASTSPDGDDATRRDGVRLLDLAHTWCGPNARVLRLRQRLAGTPAADKPAGAQDPAALSALDYYDQGRVHLRAARFREAAVDFQRVLEQRPQDFWPNFYQGLCAFRLGQFHEADAAFRTCIALAPHSAECYFNRARAAEALGHGEAALRDYSRALELDPALTAASINRGILAYKSAKNDAAIADFRQALRSTSDSQTLGLIQYNLALAYLAAGDRAARWPARRKQ